MNTHCSTVYWITGLSGAGKTTISKLFHQYLKKRGNNVILLDGDVLRDIFGSNHNYSLKDRKKLSFMYAKLSNIIASQGLDVVIATISMFHDTREWNRQNIKNYVEVFLDVPMNVLITRDQKKLYSRFLKGEIDNVIGINAEAELPKDPDFVLINDGSRSPSQVVNELVNSLKI